MAMCILARLEINQLLYANIEYVFILEKKVCIQISSFVIGHLIRNSFFANQEIYIFHFTLAKKI